MQEKSIIFPHEKLQYIGRQFCSSSSHVLKDLGIKSCSKVYVLQKMYGGGGLPQSFVDLENEKEQKIQFSLEAPQWRIVEKGLNIEGRCRNEECKAYKQMVIKPMVSRSFFNLIKDKVGCPICKVQFIPITCGFTDCLWKYEGTKLDNGLRNESQWKLADEKFYYRFSSEKSSQVQWKNLLISTICSIDCFICFRRIYIPKEKTVCGHEVHTECLDIERLSCLKEGRLLRCGQCLEELD